MKIAVLIARILLGLIFVVFGSNPFLHFLPVILPPGPGGQFLGILFHSKYVLFVGGFQVLGGALLLINRHVPLGLTILGAIIVNIILFHLLLEHAGAQLAVIATILWLFLMWRYRANFAGILAARTT